MNCETEKKGTREWQLKISFLFFHIMIDAATGDVDVESEEDLPKCIHIRWDCARLLARERTHANVYRQKCRAKQ